MRCRRWWCPSTCVRPLVENKGPYHPMLELVRAIESASAPEIRAAADAAYIEPLEINRALLKTLVLAASLDRARSHTPAR